MNWAVCDASIISKGETEETVNGSNKAIQVDEEAKMLYGHSSSYSWQLCYLHFVSDWYVAAVK